MAESFNAIVLAAGKGTRMNSDLPKVLHPLLGRPMIAHILDALKELGIDRPVVVLGFQAERVRETLGEGYRYAYQREQHGSGHAVQCAREVGEGIAENLLVLCGDSPLFRAETIRAVMEAHRRQLATITLSSAILDNPTGYGRILRDEQGEITAIVEERDADEAQKRIREVNGGLYAFDSEWLWANLDRMEINAKGELCLTDMVRVAIEQGRKVVAVQAQAEEVEGINSPEHLAQAEEILRKRKKSC